MQIEERPNKNLLSKDASVFQCMRESTEVIQSVVVSILADAVV